MKREVVCLNRKIELREVEDGRRYVPDGSLIDFCNRKTGEHEYFKCKRSKNIGNLIKIEKDEFISLSSNEPVETPSSSIDELERFHSVMKDLSTTVPTDEEAKKIDEELKSSESESSYKIDAKKETSKFFSTLAGKLRLGVSPKKDVIVAIDSIPSCNLDVFNKKMAEKFPSDEYNIVSMNLSLRKISSKWEGLDLLYNLMAYCLDVDMIYFTRGSLYEKKWILLREIADAYGIPYEIENTID